MDNFSRIRRVLHYRHNYEVYDRIQRGMPYYDKDFWDGKIESNKKPFRLKIQNISGDEKAMGVFQIFKDLPGFHEVPEKTVSRLLTGAYGLKRLVETWKVWDSKRIKVKKARAFLICYFLVLIPIASQVENGLAAAPVPICQIQGNGFSSPRYGHNLKTQGVVTADFDDTSTKGFFIQADNCDSDPSTSDGIFVYLDESIDIVSEGDFVEVSSTVAEYFGLTRLDAAPDAVQVISQGNALPPGVDLQPPFDNE